MSSNQQPSKKRRPLRTVLLFLFMLLACWPAFALVMASWSAWKGESAILDSWQLEPMRLILHYFVQGYIQSLYLALPIAVLSVIDYKLLIELLGKPAISGVLLTLAGISLAVWQLGLDSHLLIPLLLVSLLLLISYRLFIRIFRMAR